MITICSFWLNFPGLKLQVYPKAANWRVGRTFAKNLPAGNPLHRVHRQLPFVGDWSGRDAQQLGDTTNAYTRVSNAEELIDETTSSDENGTNDPGTECAGRHIWVIVIFGRGTDFGIGRVLDVSHQTLTCAVRISLRLTTMIMAASILSSSKTLWNSAGSLLSSSSYLYSLAVSRTRRGKFYDIVQHWHEFLNTQEHEQGRYRTVDGCIGHCSVTVRDGEVYLCKNVIDHPINILSRHGLDILCHFGDILVESLNVECQHILQSRQSMALGQGVVIRDRSIIRCHSFRWRRDPCRRWKEMTSPWRGHSQSYTKGV